MMNTKTNYPKLHYYYYRRVGIHLHRFSIAHNGPKFTFAAAKDNKASKSIVRNGRFQYNVYR